MEVEIYFMRHALSCTNAATRMGGSRSDLPDLVDPELSDHGVRTARAVPARDFDYVFSSVLTRAVETAHFAAPGSTVRVAPHLKERGRSAWNTPRPLKGQNEYLTSKNVKFRHEASTTQSRETKGDIEVFLAWLGTFLSTEPKHPRRLKILVVTHGGVIRRFLGKAKEPKNVECHVGVFRLVGQTLVPASPVTLAWDGAKPDTVPSFCGKSSGRCGAVKTFYC